MIEGLPEGLVLVRLGTCSPDEFELVDDYLLKGGRTHSVHHLIVKAAEGYEIGQVVPNIYTVYKVFQEPVTRDVKLVAKNSFELRQIETALEAVKDLIQ